MENILIIKNIFKYIYIDKLTYLFLLLSVLSASFMQVIIIFSLIIVHELGHLLMAKILKIEIDKIYIYPLGGITKLNMNLNTNPLQESLVLLAGPILQLVFYAIYQLILPEYQSLIEFYNYQILFFNLLPIYPLDGGKILNIIVSSKVPYKLSLKYSIFISYILLIIIILNNINNLKLNLLIMIFLLLYKLIREGSNIQTLYNKFLLERYLHNYKFKDTVIINDINEFHRNKSHIIKEKGKYWREKDFLNKKYQKF